MPPQILIDNPFITLMYHPDKKVVHHQIHKFIHGEAFREFLMTGTEAIRKNGAKKWLSDDRSNTVLSQEDVDWGRIHWFPQTVQAGWKYWAIVQPEHYLGKVSMERLVAEYSSQGVTAKFFTDPDDAMRWLEAQ